MLEILFYPESDLVDFAPAIKEFEQIWSSEGGKIIAKWEEITSLHFTETKINAMVGDLKSHSHPLTLRYNNELHIKKATLVHELGHRILYKRVPGMAKSSLERHKFLFLVLFDVLLELYGELFTREVIEWDSQRDYKEAWDWAQQFKTKIERQNQFQKILG